MLRPRFSKAEKSDYEGDQQVEHEDADGGQAQEINFYVVNTHAGHDSDTGDSGEGSVFYMLILFSHNGAQKKSREKLAQVLHHNQSQGHDQRPQQQSLK